MKISKSLFYSILILPSFLFSYRKSKHDFLTSELPFELWYTGPLLELTPVTLKPGQPAIEPVLSISNRYGNYNSNWEIEKHENIWSINPIFEFKLGLPGKSEVKVIARHITNVQSNKSSSHFQDTLFFWGIEVLSDRKNSWEPDLSLYIQAVFPTGKFDNFDPNKIEIESTGFGAYQLGPAISYQKVFHLPKNYFILYWNVIYLFQRKVKINEFNTYGGGFGTEGKITPGKRLFLLISGEYLFNQNWGIACDAMFIYQENSSNFKGTLGISKKGVPAVIGLPSSSQLSLTPSIEYNFSGDFGVFGGGWFTVAGKNSDAFAGLFGALVYLF